MLAVRNSTQEQDLCLNLLLGGLRGALVGGSSLSASRPITFPLLRVHHASIAEPRMLGLQGLSTGHTPVPGRFKKSKDANPSCSQTVSPNSMSGGP